MATKDIKYWLEEKDLKTPEHDKIVLWCFKNVPTIFEIIHGKIIKNDIFNNPNSSYGQGQNEETGYWDWGKKEYLEGTNKNNEIYRSYISKEKIEKDFKNYKEKQTFEIKEKIIEFPLSGQYNIGFLDLKISISTREKRSQFFDNEIKWKRYIGEEFNIINLFIEVKHEVKSIGEVMRQINYYRKYLPSNSFFILVTKTKGLKEIFESQKVYIHEYNEKEDNQKTLNE